MSSRSRSQTLANDRELRSLNEALAADAQSYELTLSRVLTQLDRRGTTIKRPAQPTDASKLPFNAPTRDGRRCELLARARDHMHRHAEYKQQSQATMIKHKVTPKFESLGTMPAWVIEINKQGERHETWLEEAEKMASIRRRATVQALNKKRTVPGVSIPVQREQRPSRYATAKPTTHSPRNENENMRRRGTMRNEDKRHLLDIQSLGDSSLGLDFEESNDTVMSGALLPPGLDAHTANGFGEDGQSLVNADWEESVIGGYGSTCSSMTVSSQITHRAETTRDGHQQHHRLASISARTVSSAGLSALSDPSKERPPPPTFSEDFVSSEGSDSCQCSLHRQARLEAVLDQQDALSSGSWPLPPAAQSTLGRSNTTSTCNTQLNPLRMVAPPPIVRSNTVSSPPVHHSPSSALEPPAPPFFRKVPTLRRQAKIDETLWEDRKLESYAKRVGWKAAVPRAVEDSVARLNGLKRKCQPWRAQPPRVQPRMSRDIVAHVRVPTGESTPEESNASQSPESVGSSS